jgi:nucleotidyltransferase substrate binding protein (TIGR01987 family)
MDLQQDIIRDSAIQRFEYTLDAFWKLIKVYLKMSHDIPVFSPRETIKQACALQLLSEEESEFILRMIKLRNETSHDYALEVAVSLAPELPSVAELLRAVFTRIKVS